MLENAVLLLVGLGIGVFSAAISVFPHWLMGGASVDLERLTGMFVLILLVGLAGGLAAVRATLRAPIVSALRGE